jgi:hypothetical protein
VVERQVPSVSLGAGSVLLQFAGRTHVWRCVCGCSGESALGAVEKATAEAEKHGDPSQPLAALVAEAREMIEQARSVAAEAAAAAK